jgi:hypothetical protein
MGTIKITSWNVAHLDRLTKDDLSDNDKKRRDAVVQEIQLVRQNLSIHASLLQTQIWDSFTSRFWKCHFWGEFEERNHSHYRHPQVLVLDLNGFRVEFIGLHLISARIKMTTEATNVRAYIDAKFRQVENPAIFVMGDLNDGPGKEYFEERFLFFDLVSNVQGDIFSATKFLNHALFDFPDHLRWTVNFKDFVDPERDPHILLDHIMFTQGLVNGSLPWEVEAHAGKVEHEIHDLINAPLPSKAKTSDHKPISLIAKTE